MIPVARSSRGRDGVLVVRNSGAATFSLGILTPFLHWGSALFSAFNASATFVSQFWIVFTWSVSYGFLIISFSSHLGVLLQLLDDPSAEGSTGTLAVFATFGGTV